MAAAAAYAALMSLMHTLELILHPSQKRFCLPRNQIELLLRKVRFLQEFLEDYSHRAHKEMAGLESRIILSLLSEICRSEQDPVLSDDQLGEKLYKNLYGKRYLIVMDDLWDIVAWNKIRVFLPDNCNGSRIMITTRLLNLARNLSSCKPFEMEFLDDARSWELLRYKVFGRDICPNELEELGKNIAIKCRGLPLAIVVIGGLLAKSNKTREFWEYVEENLNSIINSGDDENCLKILYLSYSNLPIHLKPCLLYMVTIPEGSVFSIGDLTRLWVAEGFLKPLRTKSLEEVAYEYITDLVDRNLIFVHSRGSLGRLKTCGMHDLLRDLCLREAWKENFFSFCHKDILHRTNFKHRRCFQLHRTPMELRLYGSRFYFGLNKFSNLFAPEPATSSSSGSGFSLNDASIRSLRTFFSREKRFLRMLDVLVENLPPIYIATMQLVNLRLMSIMGKRNNQGSRSTWMTPLISHCWSLQTLKFSNDSKEPIFLPPNIWDLTQLRHLRFNRVVLPDPPCSVHDEHGSHILKNLQTLSTVLNFRCTDEVLEKIPNLKKLKVTYDPQFSGVHILHNVVHLCKLESLKFNSIDPISWRCPLRFPHSLKVLKLSGCGLPWEDMSIVGSLPNLEELVLWFYAFKGLEWCPVEGEFVSLKLLVIGKTDLLYWKADKTHFPILEHLGLHDLDLKEIPQDLGELLTLGKIELFYCSDSTVTWAKQIREEQENLGNEYLQVQIK